MDIIVGYIFYGIICGVFCGMIASAKNRSGGGWFVAGFWFGIFALIAIAGMPTKAAPNVQVQRPSLEIPEIPDPDSPPSPSKKLQDWTCSGCGNLNPAMTFTCSRCLRIRD